LIYRALTWGLPILVGIVAVLWWRRRSTASGSSDGRQLGTAKHSTAVVRECPGCRRRVGAGGWRDGHEPDPAGEAGRPPEAAVSAAGPRSTRDVMPGTARTGTLRR